MKKSFLTWTLAVLAGAPAFANIILTESFNYPDGALTEAPTSPSWEAYGGAGVGPVLITGGQIRLTGGGQEDVSVALPGRPYSTNGPGALYASFKVKVTSAPGFNGTYFAHFMDTNTGAAAGCGGRIWISTTNAINGGPLPAGKLRFGIGNGVLATNTSGQMALDMSLSATNVLVTRFVPATGLATLWINPKTESDPSVTATDPGTLARPNPIEVATYAFRQMSGEGAMLIDDLRVGTAFADVAGTNHPPVISTIPGQTTGAGLATAPLPFAVGDVETPASNLSVFGSSANPLLVADAKIVFAGSGSNRTVVITPQPGQQGVAIITLSARDADGGVATTSFQLGVGVPTISAIPNLSTPTNTTLGPIPFAVGDSETAANNLLVTASSGNQVLMPAANIQLGGGGSNRTVTLMPAPGEAGLATVTISVSDGTSISSARFVLTVNPLLGVVCRDGFNRPDGPLFQPGGQWLSNGGSGGSNAQQMRIIGGRLQVTAAQSEDCSVELPPNQAETPIYAPASGAIFYAGMKVNYQTLPKAAGAYFAHFRDGGNGFRGRIYATTAGAAPGHYRLGVANAANVLDPAAVIATDLATNESFSIVLRYNVGTGESRLWLGPASEASAGVDAADDPKPISIQALTFRQNSDIGSLWIDDLVIGTSFADVAPPTLRCAFAGGTMEISWPAGDLSYKLLGTFSLSQPHWTEIKAGIKTVGGRQVLQMSNVSDNCFFRLGK